MIINYNPMPFEQANPLPAYVNVTEQYELLARTKTGYVIRLAKLTIGQSNSAGRALAHVLFESFSDHGERRAVSRTRANGYMGVFNAVMNAMMEVGAEFDSITPCHSDEMLNALGACIQAKNPEIESYEVVSQNCH